MVMKSSAFWDITPCSLLKVNWRFGGTCRIHLQGQKISQARNQRENRWQAELKILISNWKSHSHTCLCSAHFVLTQTCSHLLYQREVYGTIVNLCNFLQKMQDLGVSRIWSLHGNCMQWNLLGQLAMQKWSWIPTFWNLFLSPSLGVQTMKLPIVQFSPITSSLLGMNSILRTLFSDILHLRSPLTAKDQDPYKTTGRVMVLYILIFMFLGRNGKTKYSQLGGSEDSLILICFYFLPVCNFHSLVLFPNIWTVYFLSLHYEILKFGDKIGTYA
jgi:hypothetical protein